MDQIQLKGHGNEPNFPRFLHKSLWPRSLTVLYISSRFDFGFEFAEIFVFEKRLQICKFPRCASSQIANPQICKGKEGRVAYKYKTIFYFYAEVGTGGAVTGTGGAVCKGATPSVEQ